MRIKHTFESAKSDGGDDTLVRPSDWNADHTIIDPVLDQFDIPSVSYEFDTSDLTGLTTIGSPDTLDANTSLANHLYIADNDGQFVGVRYSIAPPFTAILCATDALLEADYQWLGIAAGDSSFTNYITGTIRYDGGRGARGLRLPADTQFGPTTAVSMQGVETFWLAVRVASSTDVSLYYSRSGTLWYPIIVADNPGFTVATTALILGTFGTQPRTAAAIDYLRIWNSALTFVV